MQVDETRGVFFSTSDPDGDPLIEQAQSSDPEVATVEIMAPGLVNVTAHQPGEAEVTIRLDDERGGTASTAFKVTVERPNRNPEIAPLEPVTLNVGETREVTFGVSDPDEDALQNAVALSGDPNIVQASAPEVGRVVLTGMAPGTATVTLSVEDSRGGMATSPLTVNVVQPNQRSGHHAHRAGDARRRRDARDRARLLRSRRRSDRQRGRGVQR